MLRRTLTALALIVVLAGFILCGYFVSPIFVDMLVYIFMVGAVYEMFGCLKGAGYKVYKLPVIILLIAAYPTFYLMQYYIGAGAQGLMTVFAFSAAAALIIFAFTPYHRSKAKSAERISEKASEGGEDCEKTSESEYDIKDLLANAFLLVYPTLFFSLAWVISYKYSAIFAVVYAIVVTIIGGDTFAYFFGSLIGGKKLCPKISPKKTVAGFIGSIVGATIVSVVFWVIFEYVGSLYPAFAEKAGYQPFFSGENALAYSSAVYIALGMMIGAVAELGDLAASGIKRALGIKDYGRIFPGHGGFLDRIDSVLFTLIVLIVAFACIYGR